MREGLEEKEWFSTRAKLEVPPPGYTGSLAGTGWDAEIMLQEYNQGDNEIRR